MQKGPTICDGCVHASCMALFMCGKLTVRHCGINICVLHLHFAILFMGFNTVLPTKYCMKLKVSTNKYGQDGNHFAVFTK